jgi:transketolase
VTGTLAHTALEVATALDQQGIGVTVLHMATVKPLDTAALDQLAESHELIVTLEEHQAAGGLGGAVAEYYSQHVPKRVLRIGIDDQFGQSGEPAELLTHYGLDAATLCQKIKERA